MIVLLLQEMKPGPIIKDRNLMNIEQQIKDCEKKIAMLEEFRRQEGAGIAQLDRNLNEQYEQFALLKIRKMMGY